MAHFRYWIAGYVHLYNYMCSISAVMALTWTIKLMFTSFWRVPPGQELQIVEKKSENMDIRPRTSRYPFTVAIRKSRKLFQNNTKQEWLIFKIAALERGFPLHNTFKRWGPDGVVVSVLASHAADPDSNLVVCGRIMTATLQVYLGELKTNILS